ncbi:MAG: nodulation protein NfeD [Deltaproteobacteria bacterium]|nr:nodulation protein NfeD [Deltaproteobacteria bacterium]
MKFRLMLLIALVFLSTGPAHASGDIYLMTINGTINPGLAEFIKIGIDKASEADAACLVIQLDTPGGLAESMRQIVQDFLASQIPIIVYVSPGGARAASAGVMITMAADIAAMAPGTNIGAAHPVGMGGKEIDETMSDKVVNDMVAHAKSVAQERGRNADWVEKAIRDSVSITETEALEEKVIDLVAKDLTDLIDQINGREIADKGPLKLDAAEIIPVRENLRTKILRAISDPNIAYILMMIGMAGLYFELSHPGTIFPGVIGAICLVLAFFSFQTLPVNYAGILLILLALVFFILELKVTSFGMLTVAGIVSLLLGSMMLFKGGPGSLGLSWQVLLPTVFLVSGFFIAVTTLVVKAQVTQPRTGADGLIGEEGVVRQAIDPEGKVFVHGELWQAVSQAAIPIGTRVRVTGVRNLIVEVEVV